MSKFALYFAALALALVGAILGRARSREVRPLDRSGGIVEMHRAENRKESVLRRKS